MKIDHADSPLESQKQSRRNIASAAVILRAILSIGEGAL
jgi:hypothetical protein